MFRAGTRSTRFLNAEIANPTKLSVLLLWLFFLCGAAAQRGPWPPHSWGFLITHNDSLQSVGLLWTSDQLVAETSTWQHSQQTNIHAPGGIRTHDLSRRAAADLRLRPRGYWDRRYCGITFINTSLNFEFVNSSSTASKSRCYYINTCWLTSSWVCTEIIFHQTSYAWLPWLSRRTKTLKTYPQESCMLLWVRYAHFISALL